MSRPYKQTFSGEHFDLINPDPDTILLGDVALGLSNICRFTGQASRFYSVAQHSTACARVAQGRGLPLETQRWALLHDAAEAYIGDMATPIKKLCPGYRELEKRVEDAIRRRFNLVGDMPAAVKQIDRELVMAEAGVLLDGGPTGDGWFDVAPGADVLAEVKLIRNPVGAHIDFTVECGRVGVR